MDELKRAIDIAEDLPFPRMIFTWRDAQRLRTRENAMRRLARWSNLILPRNMSV